LNNKSTGVKKNVIVWRLGKCGTMLNEAALQMLVIYRFDNPAARSQPQQETKVPFTVGTSGPLLETGRVDVPQNTHMLRRLHAMLFAWVGVVSCYCNIGQNVATEILTSVFISSHILRTDMKVS
jgi:hypothetical protein